LANETENMRESTSPKEIEVVEAVLQASWFPSRFLEGSARISLQDLWNLQECTELCAETEELDEDDFAHAFDEENDLHIDYAHAISLGFHKERYYLVFVIGGRNFIWATPTTTRMEPEALVRDFISVTGLKIGRIRVDGEFDQSTAFKKFAKILAVGSPPFLPAIQLLANRQESAALQPGCTRFD